MSLLPPESIARNVAMAYPRGSIGLKVSSPPSGHAWEDCRREARRIESELDAKLASFAKLTAAYGSSTASGESGLAAVQTAEARGAEIEGLLARLGDVNERLSSALSGGGDVRAHTLARHRDILRDYVAEFRRHQSQFGAARDRAGLLTGASERSSLLGADGPGASGALLRERAQLGSTNQALDDVMGTASAVSSGLGEQGKLFENIGNKVLATGAKFPVINSVLNAVRRKKNRDTLILSSVIAVCTLLLLIYWWKK